LQSLLQAAAERTDRQAYPRQVARSPPPPSIWATSSGTLGIGLPAPGSMVWPECLLMVWVGRHHCTACGILRMRFSPSPTATCGQAARDPPNREHHRRVLHGPSVQNYSLEHISGPHAARHRAARPHSQGDDDYPAAAAWQDPQQIVGPRGGLSIAVLARDSRNDSPGRGFGRSPTGRTPAERRGRCGLPPCWRASSRAARLDVFLVAWGTCRCSSFPDQQCASAVRRDTFPRRALKVSSGAPTWRLEQPRSPR